MRGQRSRLLLVLTLGVSLGIGLTWLWRSSAEDAAQLAELEAFTHAPDEEETDLQQADTRPAGVRAREATSERAEASREGEALAERVPAGVIVVHGPNGQPLAGAVVEARSEQGVTDRRATDAEGKTTLMLPPAEHLALRASAEGFFPAVLADHPFGQPAILVVGEAALCDGVVRDAQGAPLAGVFVEPRGPAGSPRSAQARKERTDAEGRFRLPPLAPGTYDLWLEPPAGRAPVSVAAGMFLAAGPRTLELQLVPGMTLRGTVRDAQSGQPIGGATLEVAVELKVGQLRSHAPRREATSDELGAFTLANLPVGIAGVLAKAPGHTPAWRRVEVLQTQGTVDLEITLDGTASVRGRVVTADKVPVAGAEVSYAWFSGDRLEFLSRTATSDASGHYELLDLPVRDNAIVCCKKDGFAPGGEPLGKVKAGEAREVDVDFERGIEVRGRVRGEDGKVPVVALKLVPKLGAERFTSPMVADAEGSFALKPVTPFPYRLEITAEGYLPLHKDLNLDNKLPVVDVGTFTLLRAYALEGVVLRRPTGMGVPGVRVTIVSTADKGQFVRRLVTDEYGAFVCEDLKQGNYRVFADGVGILQPREPAVLLSVPQHRRVRVVVDRFEPPATGGVIGRLLDPATGKPVTAFSVPGLDGRRVARIDDTFHLRGIPAGRVDLRFDARGFQSAIVPGVYVRAGDTTRITDIYLQPGGVLELAVVDRNGKPFPQDQVRITLKDTYLRTLGHHLAPMQVVPEKGYYRFEGLAPSQFSLEVTGPKGMQPFQKTVDVLTTRQPVRLRAQLNPVPPPKPKPQQKPQGKPKPPPAKKGGDGK